MQEEVELGNLSHIGLELDMLPHSSRVSVGYRHFIYTLRLVYKRFSHLRVLGKKVVKDALSVFLGGAVKGLSGLAGSSAGTLKATLRLLRLSSVHEGVIDGVDRGMHLAAVVVLGLGLVSGDVTHLCEEGERGLVSGDVTHLCEEELLLQAALYVMELLLQAARGSQG
ncbi:hypothetical protein GUITHDRAFT_139141 [Guillardia theta CCMP2712]|uniref:Uncharacterized protein n=1 Tax=Guillardia theta (strain CCMP2712) TaxID=905079 RepID=L1J9J2_GUITC|nr:hypothetical protein GUITHDRAFT_139141 [Guillardia theta CCMP2712]EKX45223.1 hypothetical protein GUITHDRAFT_139141 [Guillardia theta CCMP2712]|eukprot:XP_005832203.1 hypothetical protein GUITHDRAFT_139141 [Guillardia theta CCMP2712]